MKYLITIIGPTAIGKTALSIELAQHFNCEIISADSRQFYREMAIGTAVPDKAELAAAPHHFIQHKSIYDNYSVGEFEKDAIAKLDELFLTNDYAVMVGGSGLYIDAVLKGLNSFPEIAPSVRESVQMNYDRDGIEYLQHELERLDIAYFTQLKTNNPQTLQNPHRLMRFIEVSIGTGKPYSSFLKSEKQTRNFESIVVGLEADRDQIYSRIDQRVDIMIESGLLNEVKELNRHKELNALQTVGYRELFRYLDNEISLEFAISEIKKNTRRFAKRQLTWFKRNENCEWFDYQTAPSFIIDHVLRNTKKDS